ncbi:T9SS type A sorting domain-containing protein [Lacinutrix sp. Hel_I_90]|uniref:T9SS type A sorting domain-containing protein n=1 Tax=Lacinutrix sp. Hel_I_90 TaxID=1249999 RepID=UPI0006968C82|nr:T9SS type A sorting domain-containing protein [Lacinutrix sp. Hel_I_90]
MKIISLVTATVALLFNTIDFNVQQLSKKVLITPILLGFLVAHNLQAQELPPKAAYSYNIKQIHSGHSLTDPLFGEPWPGQYVNLMTDLRGTWAGDAIGKSTIPGSPIFWRWDNDSSANNYGAPSARHDIEDWELLVITEGIPIPTDGGTPPLITPANEYLSLYVNNAWNNGNQNNGAPTLLWTTWTNIDDSDGPWRATLDTYEQHWEEMMDYANDNKPVGATPVYIIPGHRMMARLYDDIQLNNVPGITTIDEFFSDTIHPNTIGAYAIAMIHYACIYNESPIGLTNDLSNDGSSGFVIPSPELALYLQTMIWDVVTNYSRTGVTDSSLSVSNNEVAEKRIIVYPNPTSETLFLNANNEAIKKVELYNMMGSLLHSKEIEATNYTIDVSSFSTGTYFLKVYASESILHKKILVNNKR